MRGEDATWMEEAGIQVHVFVRYSMPNSKSVLEALEGVLRAVMVQYDWTNK